MPLLRCQNSIPFDTNLPEDVAQNNWHFSTTAVAPYGAAIAAASGALLTFYNSIAAVYPSNVGVIRTEKWYDMSAPAPRAPVSVITSAFAPSATAGLPEECACCLSFEGELVSGVNRRRQRGRVYIGPLYTTAASISNGRVRVSAGVQQTIKNAAQALLATSGVSNVFDWVVYSPTSRMVGGAEESWYTPVHHGWVDDAFDIQRRRGPAPQTRELFTA